MPTTRRAVRTNKTGLPVWLPAYRTPRGSISRTRPRRARGRRAGCARAPPRGAATSRTPCEARAAAGSTRTSRLLNPAEDKLFCYNDNHILMCRKIIYEANLKSCYFF